MTSAEIQPQHGEPYTISRPMIGLVTGYSKREIKLLQLKVEVLIQTDLWHSQGMVDVAQNGQWVLEKARFGGISHLVKVVLRDKDGDELATKYLAVIVKREGTSQLTQAQGNDLGGCYHIIARHSGKCLDVSGSSREDCASVWQYELHGGDCQRWILAKATEGYYYIFAKHSGKSLDVEGSKLDNCTNVWQYAFHGGQNQQWELKATEDGYFHILARHSGKVLDVAGYSQENCANVWQYELHGGDNQKWILQPVV